MKKRIITAVLAALLCLSGCSGAGTSSGTDSQTVDSQTVDSQAVDSQTVDSQTVDSQTVDSDDSSTVSSDDEQSENETSTEESSEAPTESTDTTVRIDYELDPSKPTIALTFDDGPNTTTTAEILDLLEKYQVRASFFLIGSNLNDETAKVVKRAYDLGCDIENHSMTHSYMDKMTAEEIADEINTLNDKIKDITGEAPKFFRPPYIAVNNVMYDTIDMTFISGLGCNDWDDKVTTDRRVLVLQRRAKDGLIFLLHDAEGNSQTVEALDEAIPYLLEQGFQFATISELFELKGVEVSGDDTNIYTDLVEQ